MSRGRGLKYRHYSDDLFGVSSLTGLKINKDESVKIEIKVFRLGREIICLYPYNYHHNVIEFQTTLLPTVNCMNSIILSLLIYNIPTTL